MNRVRIILFFISIIAYFSACTRKVICPAYHSYFILDVKETKKTFSLFGVDSLPKKYWDIDKEKYGIAKEISDQKKQREMDIISMNSIYLKMEDPFEQFQREYAESDSIYSIDTARVLAQTNNNNDFQNIDQMIYLHHFGKYLPKKGGSKDVFKEDMKQEEKPIILDENLEEEKPPKKKKKLWPFGKKNKKADGGIVDDTESDQE